MLIKNLFERDIFRAVNGVVKADQLDESSVWQELMSLSSHANSISICASSSPGISTRWTRGARPMPLARWAFGFRTLLRVR